MPKKSPSKNLARLNEDMHRALVDIIGEMKDPRLKAGLLTITRVETDSDLSSCRVYISVIDKPGAVVAENQKSTAQGAVLALEHAKGHVRSEISARMHIRRAPEFIFMVDDNAAYAAHINELLGKL